MMQQKETPSAVPLAPQDLELLQRFLSAWCDENGVDAGTDSASDIAAALIDWYLFKVDDRNLLKLSLDDQGPAATPQLQRLVGKLDDIEGE